MANNRNRKERELELLRLREQNLGRVSQPTQQVAPEQDGFDLLSGLAGAIPELTGGVVSGIAGKALPLAKRAPLVGLGTAAGEAFKQLGQQAEKAGLGDIPLVEGADAPTTSIEALKRIGGSALAGVGGEIGGAALTKAAFKVIKPRKFIKSVTPEGKEAIETLGPLGGLVAPAQATENRALDILENVAEGSIFGGGKITVSKKKTQAMAEQLVTDFAQSFKVGASKAQLGDIVKLTTTGSNEAFDKAAGGLFKKVDNLVGGAPINTINLQKLVLEMQSREKAGLGTATSILNKVSGKGNVMSFADAQALRSDLLAVGRTTTEIIPGKSAGIAKRLASELDTAMEQGARKLSPEGLEVWREADVFWKEGKELFNSQIMKKIASSDPDVIVDAILEIKNPVGIKRIRTLINNEKVWGDIQGQYVQGIVEKATDIDSFVNGKKILQQMKVFGDENLKTFFPGGEHERLRKLARVLRTVERGQPTGIGGVAIQLVQPGAAISLATGTKTKTALAILLGPLGIARAFSNKKVVDFILKGSKGVRTVAGTARFLTKLGAILTKEGIENDLTSNVEPDVSSFIQSLQGVDIPTQEPRLTNQPRLTDALKGF